MNRFHDLFVIAKDIVEWEKVFDLKFYFYQFFKLDLFRVLFVPVFNFIVEIVPFELTMSLPLEKMLSEVKSNTWVTCLI